jgi:hypothetical protein
MTGAERIAVTQVVRASDYADGRLPFTYFNPPQPPLPRGTYRYTPDPVTEERLREIVREELAKVKR